MNKEANQMNTTKPSVEELMRPRVIVENLWPGCPFEVGDILINDGDYYWVVGDVGWYSKVDKNEVEPFPYLMRPLPWWEEREPGEMPEYVRYAENGMIAKVDHFDLETTSAWFMYLEGGIHPYAPGGSALENTHWLPATEQDYITYINSHPSKVTRNITTPSK